MSVDSFKTAKRDANRYRHAISGLRGNSTAGVHLYHTGIAVTMHSAAPPPVSEYAAWLETAVSSDPRGKVTVSAPKLRRLVQMKRNGCSLAEMARATRLSSSVVHKWLHALPERLRA